MQELNHNEINNLIEYEKLRSFIELVANGKRPDGTYNYCREALEKKAKGLLQGLKQIKNETYNSICL